MDRASTFSDSGIIRRLQSEFIPVAGNCDELQEGLAQRAPAASGWFMRMADQTEWRKQEGNTVQGFYIAGADGTAYGWLNDRDVPEVNTFMDRALAKFRARPPKAAEIPAAERGAASGVTPDASTSIVRVFTRIRPLPEGADSLNAGVGRDHLWIYRDEVRQLLAAGTGDFDLPRALMARI